MEFSLQRVGVLFFRIVTLLLIVGALSFQAFLTIFTAREVIWGVDDWGMNSGVLTASIIAWLIDAVFIYAFLKAKDKNSGSYWLSLFIFGIVLVFSQLILVALGLRG